MTTASLRKQLQQQLDVLPDDVVVEIADFAAFVMARRRLPARYLEWTDRQWREFALSQFLRDVDDEIEYTLDDAEEVYQR